MKAVTSTALLILSGVILCLTSKVAPLLRKKQNLASQLKVVLRRQPREDTSSINVCSQQLLPPLLILRNLFTWEDLTASTQSASSNIHIWTAQYTLQGGKHGALQILAWIPLHLRSIKTWDPAIGRTMWQIVLVLETQLY